MRDGKLVMKRKKAILGIFLTFEIDAKKTRLFPDLILLAAGWSHDSFHQCAGCFKCIISLNLHRMGWQVLIFPLLKKRELGCQERLIK